MSEEFKATECTWSRARKASQVCGWTGRTDKYQKHLKECHDGKEPATGERI